MPGIDRFFRERTRWWATDAPAADGTGKERTSVCRIEHRRPEFRKAIDLLSEAISLTESNEPDQASAKIAMAISASTTPAQEAWQVLEKNGLI